MSRNSSIHPKNGDGTFANRMKEHLAAYRTQILHRESLGCWKGIPMPHILSDEDKDRWNFLPEVQSALAQYVEEHRIKLHRYFAHLNSSQALALNLFFPMLPAKDSKLPWGNPSHVSRLEEGAHLQILTGKFEEVPDRKVEKTNFDWVGYLSGGGSIFCEVKYTESSFGAATSKRTDYQDRFSRIYRPKLRGIVRADLLKDDQIKWFTDNYQILRNLSYLNWGDAPDKNRVLFVLPERSPSHQQLERFLEEAVNSDVRDRIIVQGLASWVNELESHSASGTESKHWRDFREKYLP